MIQFENISGVIIFQQSHCQLRQHFYRPTDGSGRRHAAGQFPETAIKYQIAIVLAIFTALTISVTLSIFFTSRKAFDAYGILKADLFGE